MNSNDSTKDYKDWQDRYDSKTTGWDRGSVTPALQTWLDSGRLKPCSILVPGCGRGYEVVKLAAAGFEVTALDIADTPIKYLKDELNRRNLQATVIQTDLFQWQTENSFDAVLEQTCLCAIPPDRRTEYVRWLASNLVTKGQLFALFMQTDAPGGPPFHCPLNEMETLFAGPDWEWLDESEFQVTDRSERFEEARILRRR